MYIESFGRLFAKAGNQTIQLRRTKKKIKNKKKLRPSVPAAFVANVPVRVAQVRLWFVSHQSNRVFRNHIPVCLSEGKVEMKHSISNKSTLLMGAIHH